MRTVTVDAPKDAQERTTVHNKNAVGNFESTASVAKKTDVTEATEKVAHQSMKRYCTLNLGFFHSFQCCILITNFMIPFDS